MTNKIIQRNEEKIAGKSKIENLEEFFGFHMPSEDESTYAQQTIGLYNAIRNSILLIFCVVTCLFFVSNTLQVFENGQNPETIKTYIIIGISFLFIIIQNKKTNKKATWYCGEVEDKYDIQTLDCKVWSIEKKSNEDSYYAAICTNSQYSEKHIYIQSYTYHCLMANPDEDMILVRAQYRNSTNKPTYYLQTKEALS